MLHEQLNKLHHFTVKMNWTESEATGVVSFLWSPSVSFLWSCSFLLINFTDCLSLEDRVCQNVWLNIFFISGARHDHRFFSTHTHKRSPLISKIVNHWVARILFWLSSNSLASVWLKWNWFSTDGCFSNTWPCQASVRVFSPPEC